jgi:3-oxoacyl-[acyl-carrier protein] reductase
MSDYYLVFGSHGAIGENCVSKLNNSGTVIRASRNLQELTQQLSIIKSLKGVVWAQGINHSASVSSFDRNSFNQIVDVNVTYIMSTVQVLLEHGLLISGSNLVVVSSIWATLAKPNKLEYSISKAAVSALARSLSVDLGEQGILVNSVAPGPVDSTMTREQLSATDLSRITSETPLKRLVSLSEVANLITALASGALSGVTGQEIVIDGGWSVSKLV